ncbi:MAG: C69 family dipeptidase [Bacteroidales bacterium]|nr:C69 family dipeptidase [Bacteroidales bacterium]
MKNFVFLIFLFFTLHLQFTQAQGLDKSSFNCFSVLVGKEASKDGSVLFAHNEDDYGTRIVNWYKVPGNKHGQKEKFQLKNGRKIDQARETYSYLWLEMPEMEFSDAFMNEFGVTIASDACESREDDPKLVDGGIGYGLRRIMAERARTAKAAVKIAGKLVEEIGYSGSGRTYCIADPYEAWVLAIVNGQHWVAQRIPDNEVVVVPNYYTIREVDLADTVNFLGSSDLIQYAIDRRWYIPEQDSKFIFRNVYGQPGSLNHQDNILRMWRGVNMLSNEEYDLDDQFPFSFHPKKEISLSDLMKILRDHYEGTDMDLTNDYLEKNPHETKNRTICCSSTQYGFVAQLRSNLPAYIGSVLWLAPYRPCVHPFFPWYAGISEIPDGFYIGNITSAREKHFSPDEDLYEKNDSLAYWSFYNNAEMIDQDYANLIKNVQKKNARIESKWIEEQSAFETLLLTKYSHNPDTIIRILTNRTAQLAEEVLKTIK